MTTKMSGGKEAKQDNMKHNNQKALKWEATF